MANRAYLLNTERLERNPYDVIEKRGGGYVEVAEWSNAIPVPWLLAFRPEDTRRFTHTWVEDDADPASERRDFSGLAIAASLEKVLENLRSAGPTMERVVNEPRLARAYLDDALRAFGTLELPYVMLHAEEVIDGQHAKLLVALDRTPKSVELLLWWSGAVQQGPLEADERIPVEREDYGLWCGFGPGPTQAELDEEARLREVEAAEMPVTAPPSGPPIGLAAQLGPGEVQYDLAARNAAIGRHDAALEALRRAAEAGHAESSYLMGSLLQGTRGGREDPMVEWAGPGERAADPAGSLAWLRKAMELGCANPNCALLLGEMSFNGVATAEDRAAAVRWFRKAAEAGHDKGQLWMAIVHYHGYGVKVDRKAAARWALRAAAGGSPVAQFAVGLLYYQGHGVPKDAETGREWMEKAAAQGFESAHAFLAIPAWKFWERRGFFTGLE